MPKPHHLDNDPGTAKHRREIPAIQPIRGDSAFIPPGFGMWQLTASLRLPSEMQSVLCGDQVPRKLRSELRRNRDSTAASGDEYHKPDASRLLEAEARLRTTFASDEQFDFVPLYNDPNSAEQISPSLRRQSIKLLSAEPFSWLSPDTETSFSFRTLGATPFFNDFVVRSTVTSESELSTALNTGLFDVAGMLADRRSHMLAQGLAERTYNIFCPAAMMYQVNEPSRSYILVPLFTLVRLSNTSCFRRTLSLSVVMIPVSQDENASRPLDAEEPATLHTGWTLIPRPGVASYAISSGALTTFIARPFPPRDQGAETIVSLRELMQDILFAAISRSVDSNQTDQGEVLRDHIRDLIVRAVQASICGGYCSIMPDVSVAELRRWQGSPTTEKGVESKLNQEFVRIMGQETAYQWALGPPSAFRLQHGRGAEPLIPTFYFSFGLQRLLFTPSGADLESQDTSILWTVGWHLLLMTGISALLEMLGTFHHEMEHRQTATSAQEFLKEFLVDIEEYFDFDLLPVYRLDFDALKTTERIDDDFERLRERVTALGQERIIEESRKINRRLLWIAVASLLLSTALLVLALRPPKSFEPRRIEPAVQSRPVAKPPESRPDRKDPGPQPR